MKNKLLCFIAALAVTIMISHSADARIWRVNYQSNYNGTSLFGSNYGGYQFNPVFQTLQQAEDAANANDTIYVEGSPTGLSYAGITFNKKVVLIGTGYFLPDNPNTSTDNLESQLLSLTFGAGSSGSQIIGFKITSTSGITVSVSNITIKRCYFTSNNQNISLAANIQDIFILQNYFGGTTNGTTSAIGFSTSGGVTQLHINNNIFRKPLLVKSGTTIYSALQCRNNIFDYLQTGTTPTIEMNCNDFRNNIVKNSTIVLNINNGIPSFNVTHNTCASPSQFDTSTSPDDYNNRLASMSALFVPTGSPDGIYKLLPASGVAPNYAGDDGADRGAFGGSVPELRYTLSGLGPIPVIYSISTTGAVHPQNGLPVTIKARTIK